MALFERDPPSSGILPAGVASSAPLSLHVLYFHVEIFDKGRLSQERTVTLNELTSYEVTLLLLSQYPPAQTQVHVTS